MFPLNVCYNFSLQSNIIHVKISRCNSLDDVDKDADVRDVTLAPKSPKLLSAPLPSLSFIRSKYNPPMPDEMFVSGVEAERQQTESRTLGNDTAHALADRRANYERRLRTLAEDETNFVQVSILAIFNRSLCSLFFLPSIELCCFYHSASIVTFVVLLWVYIHTEQQFLDTFSYVFRRK